MHPDPSLIFLTVLAGAGQGLFILMVALDLLTGGMASNFLNMVGAIITLGLQGVGMAAAAFHLGNPSKGWKALFMWRRSWLSREVISISGFAFLALVYFGLTLVPDVDLWRQWIGVLAVAVSVSFFIASSMLYTTILYIREWATSLTPVNFAMSGILGGGGLFVTLLYLSGQSHLADWALPFVAGMSLVGLLLKLWTFHYNRTNFVSIDLANALGKNDHKITLMDSGSAYPNYNTTEYDCKPNPKLLPIQEKLVLLLAFIVPFAAWAMLMAQSVAPNNAFLISATAVVVMIAGFLLERRLFFVQGNHLQNLYYGTFRKNEVGNPLLSKAKKGYPAP